MQRIRQARSRRYFRPLQFRRQRCRRLRHVGALSSTELHLWPRQVLDKQEVEPVHCLLPWQLPLRDLRWSHRLEEQHVSP